MIWGVSLLVYVSGGLHSTENRYYLVLIDIESPPYTVSPAIAKVKFSFQYDKSSNHSSHSTCDWLNQLKDNVLN